MHFHSLLPSLSLKATIMERKFEGEPTIGGIVLHFWMGFLQAKPVPHAFLRSKGPYILRVVITSEGEKLAFMKKAKDARKPVPSLTMPVSYLFFLYDNEMEEQYIKRAVEYFCNYFCNLILF